MKTYLCFILSLGLFLHAKAQNKYDLAIRSPQAADIIRYDHVPVAKNSGRLDLNIPLLDLNETPFDMPIGIQYNSSGFMPAKAESSVGLNWSLAAGGAIYREVKGMPDDQDKDNLLGKKGFLHIIRDNLRYDQTVFFNNPSQYASELGGGYYFKDSGVEISSDIYHFSFGKHSGKFMIGMDGQAIVMSNSGGKYKVDLSGYQYYESGPSKPTILKITTDDGYVYWFGGSRDNMEYTLSYKTSGSATTIITAFHLYKAVAPNGEVMDIKYHAIPSEYNANPSFIIDKMNTAAVYSCSKNFVFSTLYALDVTVNELKWDGTAFHHNNNSRGGAYTYNLTKIALIDEITTRNQKLKFHYSPRQAGKEPHDAAMVGRLPATSGAMLDSIVASFDNKSTKKVSLRYQYGGYKASRFFLNKVTLAQGETYTFSNNLAYNFPDPRTSDIDHWNFWRNRNPNNWPIPEITIYSNGDFAYGSSERDPGTTGVDAGLITQITYPTGGTATIEYENHTYSKKLVRVAANQFKPRLVDVAANTPAGGARVKTITYYDGKSSKKTAFGYSVSKTSELSSGVLTDYPLYMYVHYYVILNNAVRTLATPTINYSSTAMNIPSYEKDHVVYSNVIETMVENETGGLKVFTSPVPQTTTGETYLGSVYLLKGTEKWTIRGMMTSGSATLYIKQNGQVKKTVSISGDKPQYPVLGLPPGEYELYYVKVNPYGFYIHVETPKGFTGPYTVTQFTDYATNPDRFEDDKFINRFSNFTPNNHGKYFYRLAQDCSKERGLIQRQEHYTSNHKVVERLEYRYRSGTDRFSKYAVSYHSVGGLFDQINKTYFYSFYPVAEIRTVYDNNGLNSVFTSKSFVYDADGYLKETKLTTSKGEIFNTKLYYPFDLTDAVSQTMKSKNMLSPVVKEEKYLGDKKLEDTRTMYIQPAGVPMPVVGSIQINKRTSLLDTRVKYADHNSYGNPQSITYDDTRKEVYLWGYKYQYVIAKIEGETYAKVKEKLTQTYINTLAAGTSFSVAQDADLRTKLNALNVHITTYEYKPLIGITRTTDSQGVSTYYTYDAYGRLKDTSIEQKKAGGTSSKWILDSYKYQFRN